jgi:hypothetical protein
MVRHYTDSAILAHFTGLYGVVTHEITIEIFIAHLILHANPAEVFYSVGVSNFTKHWLVRVLQVFQLTWYEQECMLKNNSFWHELQQKIEFIIQLIVIHFLALFIYLIIQQLNSRDSAVGIATGYGRDD